MQQRQQQFKHKYFIVRHGFSIPNQKKIIVSSLENGIKTEYGLSEEGAKAVREKSPQIIEKILSAFGENSANKTINIRLVSSPFSRAQETAKIVHEVLVASSSISSNGSEKIFLPSSVEIDERLRERNFGSLELLGDENYSRVWEEDLSGKDEESSFGAESLKSVWSRVQNLIFEKEKHSLVAEGNSIAFVFFSHGDTLQITQVAFEMIKDVKMKLNDHRSLPHLHQAECRQLC